MKIPKRLEQYLQETEKHAQMMERHFKKPEQWMSTADYHRGQLRTICEIRELFEGKSKRKKVEN
jgi:hemerythrin